MKIHEYQAKDLLREYGIPTTLGSVAASAVEAGKIARELGGRVVVKAQIHAGGRGKGGGVKVVDGAGEAEAAAESMLGKPLVTYQTGPDGQVVSRVLVEGAVGIRSELYLGMVVDRATEKVAFMASTEGGV
ncbi:MAG: acetate--CoA ligase family protein, partial [Pseudomonadota bacterium]